MEILEYMKKMQQEGKSEQDMSMLLQQSGFGAKEISDALAQTRIKQAISEPAQDKITTSFSAQGQELEQSMMNQSQSPPEQSNEHQNQNFSQQSKQYSQEQSQYAQQQPMQYSQEQSVQQQEQDPQQTPMQEYAPQQPMQYDSYQQYGASSDTMSEIAEQIVAERMSVLKNKIEAILELKNSVDIKLSSLSERLLRIEKIIDRLQLSLLQKVGEYVTNVEDIKKEMIESQKSFKSLLNAKGMNQKADYKELE